jgi:hypothetical protein
MPKYNKIKDDKFFKKNPIRRVTQKQCLKNYVKYQHPKYISKKNNNSLPWNNKMEFKKKYNSLPVIEGYWFGTLRDKQKVVVPSHDFGQCHFYNDSLRDIEFIPNDYIEVKLTDKELKENKTDYACKNPSKKIINLERKGLNLENWILQNKKEWLTIADIEKMKKGDEIKVLLLNMYNMYEIDKTIIDNKIYKPKIFFKNAWGIYKHEKDLKGEIFYCCDEKSLKKNNKKTIKNNIPNYLMNKESDKFEFFINYKYDDWFPLKNGYLPAKAKIGDTLVTLMEGKKIKWDKFPKNTPIGYITPMILWDKLDKLPNVYQLNLE